MTTAVEKRKARNAWITADIQAKYCPDCKQTKPITEFGRNCRSGDGLSDYCKECRRERDKERYHRNMQDPEWVEAERERNRLRMQKKRGNPLLLAIEQAHGRLHKHIKWVTDPEFREGIKNRRRKSYNSNPEYRASVRARNNQWSKTEKGKLLRSKIDHERRAKEKSVNNDLTLDEWREILSSQNNRCACCGIGFGEDVKPTRDHIVPVTLGGDFTAENIQALCAPCNSRKHNKVIDYRKPEGE